VASASASASRVLLALKPASQSQRDELRLGTRRVDSIAVLNLLKDLQGEFGLTYLLIAHNLPVVEHISDRGASCT
jgi:ABC-type oligopeptide transport system ATPase subunit